VTRRPDRDTSAGGSRLSGRDLLRVGSIGLRSRRVRALLSALGISIGIAAIVGVLGISQSSKSGLLSELGRLGNLISVQAGQSAFGQTTELPVTAEGMASRIAPVTNLTEIGTVANTYVYRNSFVPTIDTGGIAVTATDASLPATMGVGLAHGTFLNPATARYPTVVLGAEAAAILGIHDLTRPTQVWLGGHWFMVIGILKPVELVSQLDSAAFIGFPIAEQYFGFDGHPTELYLRSVPSQVNAVSAVLPATVNPSDPSTVTVSQPSDVLKAEVATKGAYNGLLLGLGAVALLVGGVGIANVMVISVLERRSEIGLRRGAAALDSGGAGGDGPRRNGDRRLRPEPELVRGDSCAGVLWRRGGGPRHRGRRRPLSLHAGGPPLADRGLAHRVTRASHGNQALISRVAPHWAKLFCILPRRETGSSTERVLT
jgi:putative ABC transport system permease protein